MNAHTNIQSYVLITSGGGTPDSCDGNGNGITWDYLVTGGLYEYAENYAIEAVLQVTRENGVWSTEDVSDAIFDAAMTHHEQDDGLNADSYQGRLQRELESLQSTAMGYIHHKDEAA